ncbi:MAG: hypothetical protein ACPGNT_06575 [Rhodospirillales bacterium]
MMSWIDTIGVGLVIGLGLILAAGVAKAASPRFEEQAIMMVDAGAFGMEAEGFCNDGLATFKVRNPGETWGKAATFRIVRAATGETVAVRRFRLQAGQRAALRLKDEGRHDLYRLVVETLPSLESQPRSLHEASVNCGG